MRKKPPRLRQRRPHADVLKLVPPLNVAKATYLDSQSRYVAPLLKRKKIIMENIEEISHLCRYSDIRTDFYKESKHMVKKLLAVLLAAMMMLSTGLNAEAKALTIKNAVDGNLHTLAVKSDGSLWGWGLNLYGELGLGSTKNQMIPQKVAENVASVSAGSRHSLVLKADGNVYACGANDFGQLGSGDKNNASTLKLVLSGAVEIAAGETTSFAVKSNGELWAWGDNQYGMLGDGTTSIHYAPAMIMDSVAHVYPGSFHTLALKTDGTLWVWGQNLDDQMGTGSLGKNLLNFSANPIKLLDNVKSAAAGGKHSLVIKTDGTLWAFGDNYEGELGNGTTTDSPKPIQIGSGFVQVAAGYEFSAGIKSDSTLWTWGGNTFGQLGDGSFDYKTIPQAVMNDVSSVSAAPYGLRVVKADGTLWSCGTNAYGEIGTGKTGDTEVLTQVLSGVALPSSTAGNQITADTPSGWASESVSQAIGFGLVPKDLQIQYTTEITRAEFCKLLVAILEKRTGLTADKLLTVAECHIDTGIFTDTSDADVLTVNALGIVNGKGGGLFDPTGYITRQEAAAMLYRLGDVLGRTILPDSKGYADSAQIASWAQASVDFIAAAFDGRSGTPVMQGVSGNRFDPYGYFTREQAILTALRAYGASGFGQEVLRVDYVNRRLVNYDPATMEYAHDNYAYMSVLSLNKPGGLETLLSPDYHILWIRAKTAEGTVNAQPVYIVLKAVPDAPVQPELAAGTEPFTSKLINVTKSMEYRTQTNTVWKDCAGTTVDNIGASVYDWLEVRTKAIADTSFASARKVLYVQSGDMNGLTEDDVMSVVNTATEPAALAALFSDALAVLGLAESYLLEWNAVGVDRQLAVAGQLLTLRPSGGYMDFAAMIEVYIGALDTQYVLMHLSDIVLTGYYDTYDFSASLEQFSANFSPRMSDSVRGTAQTGEYADLTKNQKEMLAYYVCREVYAGAVAGMSQLEECFTYALTQIHGGACGVSGAIQERTQLIDKDLHGASTIHYAILFQDATPDSMTLIGTIFLMPGTVFTVKDGVTLSTTVLILVGSGTVNAENGAHWDITWDPGKIGFSSTLTVNDNSQGMPVICRYDMEGAYTWYGRSADNILSQLQNFEARHPNESATVTINYEYNWSLVMQLPANVTIVVGSYRTLTLDSFDSAINCPILGEENARLLLKTLPAGNGLWELTKFYDTSSRLSPPYEGKTYVWRLNPDGGADTADDDGWVMQP